MSCVKHTKLSPWSLCTLQIYRTQNQGLHYKKGGFEECRLPCGLNGGFSNRHSPPFGNKRMSTLPTPLCCCQESLAQKKKGEGVEQKKGRNLPATPGPGLTKRQRLPRQTIVYSVGFITPTWRRGRLQQTNARRP
ncbi:hypothetical protein PGB90_009552 [Kerria lacca]